MAFSCCKNIGLTASLILFAFSSFDSNSSYANQQSSSSINFGENAYNFDRIFNSMDLKKSFTHNIDGKDFVVQLFVVADKNMNMCDDDDIFAALVWDGASQTDQPALFSKHLLNPLEKDLYYTLKHYSLSSLRNNNNSADLNKLYSDLINGGANFKRTLGEYSIIDLKGFLRDRALNYSKSETRRIVVRDNRVVAWLDFFNGSYEEGGRRFNIKYKDNKTDFYVGFTVDIGDENSSLYECVFDTADVIINEFRSMIVNK